MASENASAQASDGPAPETSELEKSVEQAAPPPVELEELDAQGQVAASIAPEPVADEMGFQPAEDLEGAARVEDAPAPNELLAEIADRDNSDDPPAPTLGPEEGAASLAEEEDTPPEPFSIETLDQMEASE